MSIKLTENPNLYLILLGGFFIAIAFLFVSAEEQKLYGYFVIVLGIVLFFFGWWGLKKSYDLGEKKKQKEIEFLEEKINLMESERIFGKC